MLTKRQIGSAGKLRVILHQFPDEVAPSGHPFMRKKPDVPLKFGVRCNRGRE